MPSTAPNGDNERPQWDLAHLSSSVLTLAPTSSSIRPPLSAGASAQYVDTSLWSTFADPAPLAAYNVPEPASQYQGQRWSALPVPEHTEARSADATLHGSWHHNGISSEAPALNYNLNEPANQTDLRQGAREDFHIPYSVDISVGQGGSAPIPGEPLPEPQQAEAGDGADSTTHPGQKVAQTRRVSFQAGESSSAPASRKDVSNRRRSVKAMPSGSATRGRRSEDGHSPHVIRKPSHSESSRSDMPHTRPGGDSVKSDVQERGPAANSFRAETSENGGMRRSILRHNQVDAFQDMSAGLPAEKGFPIQIGSELFRLSGASIMSDAPSYFSKFFEDQLRQNDDETVGVRTLYIDRDPSTFQDIARHLQGYHVQPRDGEHYVRLFADAQFYSLPQLIKQLFESEIFIQIGERNFQIPRTVFSSPGDSPNFFSLGFGAFFNSPEEIFPGLARTGLLRPPSITPPSVPNRSAETFAELLHFLRGYPPHIRDHDHRAELLRDCRYFHLRGLEQKLIMHHISYNVERQKSEIILSLHDIRQSGISFVGDSSPSDRSPLCGWVNYMRPFVDEANHELIVEIGDESLKIDFRSMRGEFYGDAKARITSLFQVVANKMNLPTNVPLGLMLPLGGVAAQPVSPGNTPLSEDKVKVLIERDAHVLLDGEEYTMDRHTVAQYDAYDTDNPGPIISVASSADPPTIRSPLWQLPDSGIHDNQHSSGHPSSTVPPPRKRKRRGSLDEFGEWIIRKGQWRLRVQPRSEQQGEEEAKMEIVLVAVKVDAVSGQKGRNMLRAFLN